MAPVRDPKIDPQPGDVLSKKAPSGKELFRCVTGRKGHDIYYVAGRTNAGKIKNCWISTWQGWANDARVLAFNP